MDKGREEITKKTMTPTYAAVRLSIDITAGMACRLLSQLEKRLMSVLPMCASSSKMGMSLCLMFKAAPWGLRYPRRVAYLHSSL